MGSSYVAYPLKSVRKKQKGNNFKRKNITATKLWPFLAWTGQCFQFHSKVFHLNKMDAIYSMTDDNILERKFWQIMQDDNVDRYKNVGYPNVEYANTLWLQVFQLIIGSRV